MKKSISLTKEQDEAVVRITACYVEQARSGGRPRLSDYLVRYPDYTNALIDFIAYYHVFEEHISQETDAFASSEVLSGVSQLALEYAWQHVGLSEEDKSCQLTTLLMKRDRQRLSFASLAKELDLDVDIVMQLEQRRIDPASIPLELSRHLALVLQQPLYVIQTYFVGESRSGSKGLQQRVAEQQVTYTVSTREGVRQVSFQQALLASTQMSDQQKDIWRKIIEHKDME